MFKVLLLSGVLATILSGACSIRSADGGNARRESAERPAAASPYTRSANVSDSSAAKSADTPGEDSVTAEECRAVDAGDDLVMSSQTFPFNFPPFENSCFVTVHNPEYDDPPMESAFAIYKDGNKVFDFPSKFNGVTFGCRVDAVSFQDLNGDKLTDIIVVGKCSAKMGDYNENSVYVNDGRTFTTNEDANYKLADLKKVKDIADFVQKNQQLFFR